LSGNFETKALNSYESGAFVCAKQSFADTCYLK
jgi:hypothetical protein